MKGTLVLKSLDNLVQGMQVVFNSRIEHLAWHGDITHGLIGFNDEDWKYFKELKQISIEYFTGSSKADAAANFHTLPLYPEDWQKALSLIGQKVEFETFEFYPRHKTLKGAKLILPKQEESWNDVWLNWQRSSYTFMKGNQRTDDSDFYEWLKQTYPAPKRLNNESS